MDKIAIIASAGSGTRMGTDLPKQFLPLAGKPVLLHTLEAFIRAYPGIKIILVLPKEQLAYGSSLLRDQSYKEQVQFVPGGDSRFQSVAKGLAQVTENSLVAVHDGVRCLVSSELIRRCFEMAEARGSAIPVIPATDSMRIIEGLADASTSRSINRETIRLVQTPQTFNSDLLKKAFAQPYQSSFTDEASVVEAMGENVYLVEGEAENIKITRPVDLIMAKVILEQRALSL